jgi:putative mRNA 3-end processing factor
MVRWLREQGLDAGAFATEYGGDNVEADVQGANDDAAPALATVPANAKDLQAGAIDDPEAATR